MLNPRLDPNKLPSLENESGTLQAFDNKERFSYFASNKNLPVGSNDTYYKAGTTSVSHYFSEHSLQIRIKFSKSGLYHFSINAHAALTDSAAGSVEFLLRKVAPEEQYYVRGYAATLNFKGSYDKEAEFFVRKDETFHFEVFADNFKGSKQSNISMLVNGHLIIADK